MKQNSSCKANSHSASWEMPHILQDTKVHYHICNNISMDPTVCHLNSIHIIRPLRSIIVFPFHLFLDLQKLSLLDVSVYALVVLSMCGTISSSLIWKARFTVVGGPQHQKYGRSYRLTTNLDHKLFLFLTVTKNMNSLFMVLEKQTPK